MLKTAGYELRKKVHTLQARRYETRARSYGLWTKIYKQLKPRANAMRKLANHERQARNHELRIMSYSELLRAPERHEPIEKTRSRETWFPIGTNILTLEEVRSLIM